MAFNPIPAGTPQWDVPLNAALVTQDTQLSSTSTTVATLQTQISSLQSQVTALSAIATGGSYYRLIAAADSSSDVKSKADYVCDGSQDEVEIQTAINAAQLEGGGVIQLSEGSFNLTTPIIINGTTNEDNPLTVTLKGCGEFATYLRPVTNVNAIAISNWAQLHLADFGVVVQGSGSGIVSQAVTTTDTRSFWASSFRNLRINGEYDALNTGWAMDLAMPWRSVFENIEIEGTRNGMRLKNEGTIQNAGDCTFTRMFIEIVGDGGTAIHISSPSNNMNQNNFNMVEAGANGPNCTGILIDGASGGASQRFWGTNLEQFKFLVNVVNGESNVFDLNYVTCDDDNVTGNIAFQCGSTAFNNVFSSKWVNVPSGQTLTIIDDNNTAMDNAPNIFQGIRIENNGGTVNYDRVASTVFRDITTFNDGGTIQSGLLQYPSTAYEPEGMISVLEYGAKGDGVTDDTTAIQAAINAKGVTFFPPGTYLTGTLVIPTGAVLAGAGRSGYIPTPSTQASTLKLKNGNNAALLTGADQVSNVVIRNLSFDGNKANNTSGSIILLADGAAQDTAWHIHDCFLDNAASDGIHIGEGRQAVKVNRTWIMRSASSGVGLYGSDANFDTVLIGLSTVSGIHIGANAWVTHINHCDIWSSGQYGINSSAGAYSVSITGTGIDRHERQGLIVGGGSVSVEGGNFHSNSSEADDTYPHIAVTGGTLNLTGVMFGTSAPSAFPSYCVEATGTARVQETANYVATASVVRGFISDVTKVVPDITGHTSYDHGLNTWTHDPFYAASQAALTNGTVFVVKLNVRRPCTIDTLWYVVATASTTPTAAQNWIGLYNSAGTKLAEVDIGTATTSTGTKSATITPQFLEPGFYWVALLGNAATPAQLLRGSSFESSPNINLATAERRAAVAATSRTTLPATFTPGTLSTSGAITLFAGMSQ